MNKLIVGLGVFGLSAVLAGELGAQPKVPAQHDVAAKWERDGNLQFKHSQSQRPYVTGYDHKYYVSTNKKTGKTTVRHSKKPFMLSKKRQKQVMTTLPLNGTYKQVGIGVEGATAIHATEMANTLWNGNAGRNAQGAVVRGPATPSMTILPYLPKGVDVIQVRYPSYKKNIAPKYLVTGLKPNAQGLAGLRVRLLLPTSSHDGGTVEGGRRNALKYAKVDKFALWQTDPDSAGHTKKRIKTLADAIPSLGQLVTPVDMVLPLKKGKTFQMQMDPLPGMTAGPGGFYSGRTVDIQWVDRATFQKALNGI